MRTYIYIVQFGYIYIYIYICMYHYPNFQCCNHRGPYGQLHLATARPPGRDMCSWRRKVTFWMGFLGDLPSAGFLKWLMNG